MNGKTLWFTFVISLIILVGYSVVQGIVVTTPLPQANHDIILRTFGTLDMLVGAVAGFWLGASVVAHAGESPARTIIDVKGKPDEETTGNTSVPSSNNITG